MPVFKDPGMDLSLFYEKPFVYQPPRETNVLATIRAAARHSDNTVVNTFVGLDGTEQEPEPLEGYNPFTLEGELDGYEDFADYFVESNSPQETAQIKRQVDLFREDMQAIGDNEAAGFLTMVALGIADPVNFIPVAGVLSRIRGLSNLGRAARTAIGAAATGAEAVAAAGIQEAVAQQVQPFRTDDEAIANLAINALAGAMLGGVAGSMSAGQTEQIGRALAFELENGAMPKRYIDVEEFNRLSPEEQQAKIEEIVGETNPHATDRPLVPVIRCD